MPGTPMNRERHLSLSGTDVALLISSTFLAMGWWFAEESARSLRTANLQSRAGDLCEKIGEQARTTWAAADVWNLPSGPWTRELIARRGATPTNLRLTQAEILDCVSVLRVAHAEFRNCWGEFCVASPGNIDWHDATPESLLELAAKLQVCAAV